MTASSKISFPHFEQNFIVNLLNVILFLFGIILIIILFWNFVKTFWRYNSKKEEKGRKFDENEEKRIRNGKYGR